MFCRACGAKLLEGARFCGSCGASQAQKEPEQPTMIRPPAEAPARPLVAPPAEATVDPHAKAPAEQSADPASQPDDPTQIKAGAKLPAAEQPIPSQPPYVPVQPVAPPQPQAPSQAPSQPVAPYGQPPAPAYEPPPYGAPSQYAVPGQYTAPGQYGQPLAPSATPRKRDRRPLWIGLAATAIIIIGAAVAVWLLVIDKDEPTTTSTTKVVHTTTTKVPSSTTSVASSTTTSTSAPSTTVTLPPGAPGDSPGQWVELDIPGLPTGAYVVAVSDKAMLIDAEDATGYTLYAYLFETKELVQLPIDGPDFGGEDIDGLTAVWWEGSYNESTSTYSDEYIYSYQLPKGPKVKIAGGDTSVYYPQIAGQWVTWVQEERWKDNPDEYFFSRVFGVTIDPAGNPRGDVVELVPAATSYAQGDTSWTYSLSETHLAWENAAAVDVFDPGVYTLDLTTLQPQIVETEVWRPSTSGDKVIYTGGGLVISDLGSGKISNLDPQGDFASAAPTFAAYFRPKQDGDLTVYEIVARGYTGNYEQTLGTQEDPPWLSPLISTSANHVAFIVAGAVHVFEWQGPKTY